MYMYVPTQREWGIVLKWENCFPELIVMQKWIDKKTGDLLFRYFWSSWSPFRLAWMYGVLPCKPWQCNITGKSHHYSKVHVHTHPATYNHTITLTHIHTLHTLTHPYIHKHTHTHTHNMYMYTHTHPFIPNPHPHMFTLIHTYSLTHTYLYV